MNLRTGSCNTMTGAMIGIGQPGLNVIVDLFMNSRIAQQR
jgi:hypothetical protein